VSRFLFVVQPLSGHANPAAAVAGALLGRGHEVAWCGPETFFRPLLGPDATVFSTGTRIYRDVTERGPGALQAVWRHYVVPQARFTLRAVDQAALSYQPDVLVADQHALAGALVARRRGLRWATLAPGLSEMGGSPEYTTWVQAQLTALRRAAGEPAGAEADEDGEQNQVTDLRFSPYLVISFTTEALLGRRNFPGHFALVGPAMAPRGGSSPWSQWSLLDPTRRKLLVTMGTLAADLAGDFYQRVANAVAPLRSDLQAIVIAPPATLPVPPENVLVTPHVPMLELLPHIDAVVSHGGMNTVCETLAHGIPLVVAPIRWDQPRLAAQVAAAGAGLEVDFSEVTPAELDKAVRAVLDGPGYRAAAARIRDSFAAAGGAARAALLLEQLAVSGHSH
jgi:zeaxanthin glucosyltransferase